MKRIKSRNGFTLMELLIVIAVMGILMAIVVPVYKSSVRKANEASAVSTLNAIKVAQAKYVLDHKDQYGTLHQLFEEGYLDRRFKEDPTHHRGYIFIVTLIPKVAGHVAGYSINANPEQWEGIGATGKNFYYTDPDSGINYKHDGPATVEDDTL